MYPIFKVLFDRVFAIIFLLFLSPIFILIGILIKISSKGPVFFIQKRLGKHGQVFGMFKFRSMFVDSPDLRNSDGTTYNSKNDSRVTRIGKFLREYSLDELPQIINILKGDMSFIGPRPELPESYETHSTKDLIRLNVKPGISGWAAVNGRNKLGIKQRRVYDVYYVENLSFILDIRILFKTILLLVKKEDIYS